MSQRESSAADHWLSDPVTFIAGWEHSVDHGPGRRHRHDAYELVYHAIGCGTVTIEDGPTLRFAPGALEIVPPDVKHEQYQQKAGRDYCIHFMVAPAIAQRIPTLVSLPADQASGFAGEAALLGAQPSLRHAIEQRICDCRITALLFDVLRSVGIEGHAPAAALNPGDQIAERAHHYIRTQWRHIRRLKQVADHVGVSEDYLRHAFRKRHGMSLRDLFTQMRIEHGKDLLRRSALPQKRLATMCGFADIQQFSRRFRQITGVAPGTYRRRPR